MLGALSERLYKVSLVAMVADRVPLYEKNLFEDSDIIEQHL